MKDKNRVSDLSCLTWASLLRRLVLKPIKGGLLRKSDALNIAGLRWKISQHMTNQVAKHFITLALDPREDL